MLLRRLYDAPMNDPATLYRRAVDALNRGDWAAALEMAARVLPAVPRHPGVHFVVGVAALQLNRMPVALKHLRLSTTLNPSRGDYGAQLARALASAHLLREAVAAADAAMAAAPEDALSLDTLGVVYTQANEHEKAASVFRRAAEMMPDRASFRFNLATSLMFAGDVDGAEMHYEACLSIEPGYWKAHLALAQLRRQTTSSNHVDRLLQLLDRRSTDADGSMYINLALAKEYEDLGDFPRAFSHLAKGKSAGKVGRRYSFEDEQELAMAIERAAPPLDVGWSGGDPTDEPIFVVGMPRTGTTLLDRIISSHPDVHSAGELNNFGVLLKRASGSRSPRLLDRETIDLATAVDWRELGRAYVESTRPGTGRVPRFVDKLPHNFLYLGFIARALPNAKLICLRRDPMDTCLSNFRQLFEQRSPYYDYSFDLLDTGRHYLMFNNLLEYWRRALPSRILEVRYEDVVQHQEASTRRVIEFCGLSWDEGCLNFENNAAPVATASVVQVREPIYRTAVGRWKRYERELVGLKSLLVEGGVEVD